MLKTLFKSKSPPLPQLNRQEIKELTAKAVEKLDFAPPEFLDWRESIRRMAEIRASLKTALDEKSAQKREFIPAWALWLEMGAAIKTLETVNSDALNCAVPWNKKTGFPSLPSMVADARKYAETLKNGHKPLALILDSFCAWTPIFKGSVECCCGAPGFKFRKVEYEVAINYGLSAENGEVAVIQLVGIKTDDIAHLKTHFSNAVLEEHSGFQKFSKVLANTNIIFTAENRLRLSGGAIAISQPFIESAREFSLTDFHEFFENIIASAPR